MTDLTLSAGLEKSAEGSNQFAISQMIVDELLQFRYVALQYGRHDVDARCFCALDRHVLKASYANRRFHSNQIVGVDVAMNDNLFFHVGVKEAVEIFYFLPCAKARAKKCDLKFTV